MPETSATERGLLPSEEQLETARTLATSMARQTGAACWHVLCALGALGGTFVNGIQSARSDRQRTT